MIIDTSALLAILQLEPEARRMVNAIRSTGQRMISAATLVEASIIAESRNGEQGTRDLDAALARLRVEISPVTANHAMHARRAFRRYGKGRHPARLNFGDCFAYALAKATGEPLLFKGDDFSKTDIAMVDF
jgi:ribonuclease VapC